MTRTTRFRLVARAARFAPRAAPHLLRNLGCTRGVLSHAGPRGRRAGVTLIEILVVMAIIGILIALTSAALQKTVDRQKTRSSEQNVFKLQQSLDSEYERVVNRCAMEAQQQQIPQEVLAVCDNDPARAKAAWTALQLRLAFPVTFAEAQTSLTVVDSTGTPRFVVKPPVTFAAVAGMTGDATRPHEESGALLYLVLAQRSVAGGGAMAASADDLTQASRVKVQFKVGNTTTTKEFEAFADAYKNAIGYERWAKQWPPPRMTALSTSDEIQKPPFVDGQKAVAGANLDPLDPQNVVRYQPAGTWNLGANDQRRLIPTGLEFTGQNRMITAYSLGRSIKDPTGTYFTPEDDILGFRLRKQGEKGFKQ